MDPEVKEELSKKGKDPHFGAEKNLYISFKNNCLKLQALLFAVRPDPKPIVEQMVRLLQRVLSSTSQVINIEQRGKGVKISCKRKSLVSRQGI